MASSIGRYYTEWEALEEMSTSYHLLAMCLKAYSLYFFFQWLSTMGCVLLVKLGEGGKNHQYSSSFVELKVYDAFHDWEEHI